MDRILVITYPETALGFRMAGADVLEIERGRESPDIIEKVVEEGRYGLLIVEEGLLDKVPEDVEKRIRKRGRPVLVSIRSPQSWEEGPKEPYIAKLLRRAIGYHIKIKR